MAEQLKPQLIRIMLIPGPKWLNRPVANEVVRRPPQDKTQQGQRNLQNAQPKFQGIHASRYKGSDKPTRGNGEPRHDNPVTLTATESSTPRRVPASGKCRIGAPLKHRVQLL